MSLAPPAGMVEADIAAFSEVDPAIVAAEAKQRAQAEKRQQQRQKPISAKAAAKVEQLAEQRNAAEEASERAALLRKIKLYYDRFGERITYRCKATAKTNVDDLRVHVAAIEADLGMSGGGDAAATGFVMLMKGVEQLTNVFNPLNLQLSGPRATLGDTIENSHDAWRPLIDEFVIKHERMFCMSVEKRILFFIAQAIMTVDRANRMADRAAAPVNADLQQQGDDL